MIGLDGAICGFFIVYILPFFIRKCSIGKSENISKIDERFNKSIVLNRELGKELK
jgi:hypothetical protein